MDRKVDVVEENKVLYLEVNNLQIRLEPHEAKRLLQRLQEVLNEG